MIRRFLTGLERVSLAFERPVNRLVRSPQFNPLYHAGTITFFLLLVILATGVYLTMFYQFGFAGSYQAVVNIEASPVGRVIRALHRYASELALIAAALHGWRTFFMDRFRGPRWLAWVTGVVLAVVLWAVGVSGYWLVSDSRTQLLNRMLASLAGGLPGGSALLTQLFVTDVRGAGWLVTLGILAVHLLLSAVVGLFFWIHIRRLSRAKTLPPVYWMALLGSLLVLAAILAPAGLLPPPDPLRLPGPVNIDLWFLWFLPIALRWPPTLFWGAAILMVTLSAAIPWLLGRRGGRAELREPVVVDAGRCTGCTLCAADCPYKAISMAERSDNSPTVGTGLRGYKQVAVVNPKLCVSCGICIGSCSPVALTMGGSPIEPSLQDAITRASQDTPQRSRIVFVCERHALHGARSYVGRPDVIPVTCIAMAHPDLAAAAFSAGVSEVQFVGCPPEDCANREGNLWTQERLMRRRPPRLERQPGGTAVRTDWLPPDDFTRALLAGRSSTPATAYGYRISRADWRGLVSLILLLSVLLALQIWLSRASFRAYGASDARVQVAIAHRSGSPLEGITSPGVAQGAPGPIRLKLEIDGTIALDETYPAGLEAPRQIFEEIAVPPGSHRLRLSLVDPAARIEPLTLLDATVPIEPGQVLVLRFRDALPKGGDPAAGRRIYLEGSMGVNAGCRVCHSLDAKVNRVGPSFAHIGTRAATRVAGMSAAEYLYQSIVEPDAYVVEGFPQGLMLPDAARILTEEQIRDLVAYLMTLK
jgi:ferredoxin